jgi:hypothetical protein
LAVFPAPGNQAGHYVVERGDARRLHAADFGLQL